jgi:hypothetical protein
MAFYLRTAHGPRVSAAVRGFAVDAGLDVSAPLLDGRIVSLAAGRPGLERSRGPESKRLLREAMRGLLPDSVLAPRAQKTGLTIGYFERAFRRDLKAALSELSDGRRSDGGQTELRLSDLGIVDPTALSHAADGYLASRDPALGLALYLTLQTEWWLRTHPNSVAG